MLKYYLEMELDEHGKPKPIEQCTAYPYFNGGIIRTTASTKVLQPLAITQHPLYESYYRHYQHRYPVISLDFKDTFRKSLDETIDDIRNSLANEIFPAHNYVRPLLSREDGKNFDKYVAGDIDKADVIHSIRYLSKLLSQHFHQPCYILIDEYDAPITDAFRTLDTSEIAPIINFFRRFYGNTLKSNPHMQQGFLTGILRITQDTVLSSINNVQEYNMTHSQYAAHYGFTEAEVNQLLTKCNIPANLFDTIKKYYNGYTIGSYKIYNPWSMVIMIKEYRSIQSMDIPSTHILKNYWCESGYMNWASVLRKRNELVPIFQNLVFGHSIKFTFKEKLTLEEFYVLKTVIEGEGNIDSQQPFEAIYFSYLFSLGYLTPTMDGKFTLPNEEIKNYFRAKMKEYYTSRYRAELVYFQSVADALIKLSESNQDTQKISEENFVKLFHHLLHRFASFDKGKGKSGKKSESITPTITMEDPQPMINGNEQIVHSILKTALMYIDDLETFAADKYVDKDRRPDIVVIRNKQTKKAIIIELTFNKTATLALQDILARNYAAEIVNDYPTFIIGIHVSMNKKVAVQYKNLPKGTKLANDGSRTSNNNM